MPLNAVLEQIQNYIDNMTEISIIQFLDKRQGEIKAFLIENPELAHIADSMIFVARLLSTESTLKNTQSNASKVQLGMMWQTAADYYEQSLEHILARELDAGIALLRMAVELARDAAVIGKNMELINLWKNREKEATMYRKKFKFNREDSVGDIAFGLYKISSQLGIHGHMTSLAHAEMTGEKTVDGKGALFKINEKAIYSGLQIWFRGYLPIHSLFSEAFHLHQSLAKEPFDLYKQLVESLDPIIEAIDQHLGEKPGVVH